MDGEDVTVDAGVVVGFGCGFVVCCSLGAVAVLFCDVVGVTLTGLLVFRLVVPSAGRVSGAESTSLVVLLPILLPVTSVGVSAAGIVGEFAMLLLTDCI